MTININQLDFKSAAFYWYGFGLDVTPIIPGTELPAVKYDPCLDGLSTEMINDHWDKHPDHEVGFIVGDDVIVFYTDSPAAIAALAELEKTFDTDPLLTIATSKGVLHYFRRAPGTFAKTDSHDTKAHPDRIEVRTGRALVVLPPSIGKEVDIDEAQDVSELTEASQEFIDAVFIHNGLEAPRPPVVKVSSPRPLPADTDADISNIISNHVEDFVPCEFETIEPHSGGVPTSETISGKQVDDPIVLEQFSLPGSSAELEAEALEQVFVLASIALLGQWTVLYARHNTGKTLIVIYLLVEAIRSGLIKASNIFYFNLDDTQHGLTEKLKIAEEMGFHVLCDGYRGFKVADFISYVEELCRNNQARGKVLVLDTLKKFTDLMDKRRVSRWNEVIRRFIAKGGTVIGLAHVNKKPGADGKSVYTGTSDIIDDADCAYILDVVSTDDTTKTKIVEFENRKRRGNVVNRVSYSFSIEDGLSYQELLASVCLVEESELVAVKQAEEIKSDADIISTVIACINDGVTTKMRLRDAVSDRIGCSKRSAIKIIEKYCGSDPAVHRWTFTVGERGAQVFSVLDPGTPPDSLEDSKI